MNESLDHLEDLNQNNEYSQANGHQSEANQILDILGSHQQFSFQPYIYDYTQFRKIRQAKNDSLGNFF
jgi:hypothetical protein